jgi:hypothetical protein
MVSVWRVAQSDAADAINAAISQFAGGVKATDD